jgi:hypothetical protein
MNSHSNAPKQLLSVGASWGLQFPLLSVLIVSCDFDFDFDFDFDLTTMPCSYNLDAPRFAVAHAAGVGAGTASLVAVVCAVSVGPDEPSRVERR